MEVHEVTDRPTDGGGQSGDKMCNTEEAGSELAAE
jgi:hypothetical protein